MRSCSLLVILIGILPCALTVKKQRELILLSILININTYYIRGLMLTTLKVHTEHISELSLTARHSLYHNTNRL